MDEIIKKKKHYLYNQAMYNENENAMKSKMITTVLLKQIWYCKFKILLLCLYLGLYIVLYVLYSIIIEVFYLVY